jgi:hypothetical protein
MGGNENRGQRVLPFSQLSHDIQAVHCGHMIVDDQATKVWKAILIQQFVGRREGAHVESFDLKQELEGFSHRKVIIQHQENVLCVLIHNRPAFGLPAGAEPQLAQKAQARAIGVDASQIVEMPPNPTLLTRQL